MAVKKKPRIEENRRPWSDLPTDLLDLITKRFTFGIDFFSFRCVCRSWRSYAAAAPPLPLPPLLLLIPSQAKKSCYLQDIFNNNRVYKTKLPLSLSGKSCIGLSCGYMIVQDRELSLHGDSEFWILNLFTRHRLRFPEPPDRLSRAVVASPASSPSDLVVVGIRRCDRRIWFCRRSDPRWTVYETSGNVLDPLIADVIVYQMNLYLLMSDASMGILHLYPSPELVKLGPLNPFKGRVDRRLAVAPGGDHLLMIGETSKDVYSLNLWEMRWEVASTRLRESQALFVDVDKLSCGNRGKVCAVDVEPGKLLAGEGNVGGAGHVTAAENNRVYRIVDNNNLAAFMWEVADDKSEILVDVPSKSQGKRIGQVFWCFRDLGCTIDTIHS